MCCVETDGFMALISANVDKENGFRITLCVGSKDIGHWEHLVPLVEPLAPLRQVFVEISSVFWISVEGLPKLYIVSVKERAFLFWPCGELVNPGLTHILR